MSVSVIIPALNEERCIEATLRAVRAEKPSEIIVVDGGSSDRTVELSEGTDVLLRSPKGRAVQMNAGARRARGDILLFLHADCILEAGGVQAVEEALTKSTVACCFQMRVAAEGMLYRCLDAAATLRTRLTGLIYGDQGLAIRPSDFARLGGFPELRLMEDIFFSRRLRDVGRVQVLRKRIYVSPRRWRKAGIVRQSLRNWVLTTLAACGASPDLLGRFYPEVR